MRISLFTSGLFFLNFFHVNVNFHFPSLTKFGSYQFHQPATFTGVTAIINLIRTRPSFSPAVSHQQTFYHVFGQPHEQQREGGGRGGRRPVGPGDHSGGREDLQHAGTASKAPLHCRRRKCAAAPLFAVRHSTADCYVLSSSHLAVGLALCLSAVRRRLLSAVIIKLA